MKNKIKELMRQNLIQSSITIIVVIVFCFQNYPILAQSPNYIWAKSAGGLLQDEVLGCSSDANGNVFITGCFSSSSITFGTYILNNMSTDTYDMYIAKYDKDGNVLWAQSAGGIQGDLGCCCSTDVNGNVFVVGYFESSSLTFGDTTINNTGSINMYIVKYDPSGNVLWAKSSGGTYADIAIRCVTDSYGNIIVVGKYFGSSLTFGTTTITHEGGGDIFLVKYDASGNVLWASGSGGTGLDEAWACNTDNNGNIFVTGPFCSPTITFGTTTLTNAGGEDVYIVKYGPDGNTIGAISVGGSGNDSGWTICPDSNGDFFVAGFFDSPEISFGTTTLLNSGTGDAFIVKYDADLNVVWAKKAGGNQYDVATSCIVDDFGNVFVTGYHQSSAFVMDSLILYNSGSMDMFFAQYDAQGDIIWATNEGGNQMDISSCSSIDPNGNFFVAGHFDSSEILFGQNCIDNEGELDAFLVKFNMNSISVNVYQRGNFISIFPNPCDGKFYVKTNETFTNIDLLQTTKFEIFNTQGEKVKTDIAKTYNIKSDEGICFDLSDQASGVYFVKISSDRGVIHKKVIIQR